MTYEEVKLIRRRLPRTWPRFFGLYGKLLPVQVQTIPLVLDKENVVVQSPTASGKTEAVIAPILEKVIEESYEPPSVLYISPTRALVYDLYERLHIPVRELGLEIAIRTGEKRQFDSSDPQDILLTTPESFDSLICRNERNLKNVRFVVLDELHLIDGGYRGDQVRMCLVRLEQLIHEKIQYCALSATLDSPIEVASKYFTPVTSVRVSGAREIHYEMMGVDSVESFRNLLEHLRRSNHKKALIFCNSRKEVEELTHILKRMLVWPPETIFAHHGSLGGHERIKAENALRKYSAIVCVTTMTLEVGIDIGDIDVIVLYRPPPSVSSLLQRIGRGNRRQNITRAIGLFTDIEEKIEFDWLFQMASEGLLESCEQGPCYSVAVQQIFSMLYQNINRGVEKSQFSSVLKKLPMSDLQVELLLQHLSDLGYIDTRKGIFLPTMKLGDLGDLGYIHSNIPSNIEFTVVDDNSGKAVGEISSHEPISKKFLLSGKRWQIVSISGNKIKVTPSAGKARAPSFPLASKHGRYFGLLPDELKKECCKEVEFQI